MKSFPTHFMEGSEIPIIVRNSQAPNGWLWCKVDVSILRVNQHVQRHMSKEYVYI